MSLAPVVLFTYNRPEHLKKTVEALKNNINAAESLLYVYSDGYKGEFDKRAVEQVRHIIDNLKGFKEVNKFYRKNNLGLAASVITGVTEVINSFGKVIVLEDDLVTSSNFLCFMNAALDKYEDKKDIYSVSGYTFPVNVKDQSGYFLLHRPSSWGWASWKDRWNTADWQLNDFSDLINNKQKQELFSRGGDDLFPMLVNYKMGLNKSWAVRWAYSHMINNAYCFYSSVSKVRNIGTDASGTHFTRKTSIFDVSIDEGNCSFNLPDRPEFNGEINQAVRKFIAPSPVRKLINYFKVQKVIREVNKAVK